MEHKISGDRMRDVQETAKVIAILRCIILALVIPWGWIGVIVLYINC